MNHNHTHASHCHCNHKHTEAEILPELPEETPHEQFSVDGMDCSEEVEAVRRVLSTIEGVLGVRAELVASRITVYHNGSVPHEDLAAGIRKAGLHVRTTQSANLSKNRIFYLVACSGIATVLGLILQWSKFPVASNLAFLVAIVAGGILVVPKAIRSVRTGALDINVLMLTAVIGAVAIGAPAEGASVMFLFALSELLESWSVGRARRAIQSLMQLTPDLALVRHADTWMEVPASEVRVDETILIKPGQKSALDGTVVSGSSTMDQSPITGESIPVEKNLGDTVFAGAINGAGALEIKTTKLSEDTAIARMIHMVEEAQQQRAPAQRFVDAFAKIYTPSVLALAILFAIVPPLFFSGEWHTWIYRALVLLVIACPCSLVISTPVSIVSGLSAMARAGVLIKGGIHLEALAKLRAIAMDKTGTITEGKPQVLEVIAWNDTPAEQILRVAAGLDVQSSHPLAQAVVQFAKDQKIEPPATSVFQSLPGLGAKGMIDGHAYFVGNHRLAHELGVCSPALEAKLAEIESAARSVVVVGHQPHEHCMGEVLGILAVGDRIRSEAKSAIDALHKVGIRKVIMLSGDNTRTAKTIAKEVGIDEAYGDLLPEQKIEKVRELIASHQAVGMIGDGINDAPALAAATVGFAMGTGGTDAAIETADVALIRDDLSMISKAIRMGKSVAGMIRFNIIFSLVIKAIFLLLALFGYTSLWLAVLADTGATLFVVTNALRLLRVR